MTPPWVAPFGDGARISIRVQPRASRTEIAGPHGEALRVRLASPPVDGAANEELVSFIAKRLRRPKSAVRIVRGRRGRLKTLSVNDILLPDVVEALWPGSA